MDVRWDILPIFFRLHAGYYSVPQHVRLSPTALFSCVDRCNGYCPWCLLHCSAAFGLPCVLPFGFEIVARMPLFCLLYWLKVLSLFPLFFLCFTTVRFPTKPSRRHIYNRVVLNYTFNITGCDEAKYIQ